MARETFDGQLGKDLIKADAAYQNQLDKLKTPGDFTPQDFEDLGSTGKSLDVLKTGGAAEDAFASGDTEGGNDLLRDFVDRHSQGSPETFEAFDDCATLAEHGSIAGIADHMLSTMTGVMIGVLAQQDGLWNGIKDMLADFGQIDPEELLAQQMLDNLATLQNIANVFTGPPPDLSDFLEDMMAWYQLALIQVSQGHDPLVLDLDGDGVELIDQQASHAYFDLDDDGFAEQAGWAKGDDGFLCRDLNADGRITSMDEVFGTDATPGLQVLHEKSTNYSLRLNIGTFS